MPHISGCIPGSAAPASLPGAALKLYKEHGCQALIATGGGSAMDCAKAVGARVAYPGKTLNQLKGTLHVLRKIPLLIAIPTTAGTDSENTLAAVITDPDQKYKYVLNDFVLIPKYAVLDAYGSSVYKKLQQMGCAAGVCTEEDSPEEGAKKFIAAIRSLNERMQIPTYIEGIQENDIPVMAAHAEKEANPLYPVPKLMTKKELENFYRVLQPAK